MSSVSLQMWEPYRQTLMAEHRFFVEQARKRLLSQFENISEEAETAAEEHLERISAYFNPDFHDQGDFYESANDKAIEFYQLLSDMHEDTRLSVAARMYHEWEKKLKDWLLLEMRHWGVGQSVKESIWRQDFAEIVSLLASFGFDARRLPFYDCVNAMRLVVNVFKHGDGKSFNDLKETYPEFVPDPLGSQDRGLSMSYLDYTNMRVSDEHLDSFSEAILAFWQAVPEHISLAGEVDVPKWFERAYEKDMRDRDD